MIFDSLILGLSGGDYKLQKIITQHPARGRMVRYAGRFQRAAQVPVSVNKVNAQINVNIILNISQDFHTYSLHFTYLWTVHFVVVN